VSVQIQIVQEIGNLGHWQLLSGCTTGIIFLLLPRRDVSISYLVLTKCILVACFDKREAFKAAQEEASNWFIVLRYETK